MKLLITGATGFIGQNLLPMLERECTDTEIMILCRSTEKTKAMFPNVSHIVADDWTAVRQFQPEIVFHLAAMSTSRNDAEVIEPLVQSNILYGVKLLNVLSECRSLKLFVNTGSFAEYRWGTERLNSAYLYAATKTAFRSFLEYYSDLCHFKYITAVPYTVYGGKPTVKRLMDYIMESIDAPEPIDMTAGEQVLDFIHVDDVSSFFVHIVKHIDKFLALSNAEDFYLGTGRGTSIRELVAIIERTIGKRCNINWGGRTYRERDTMYCVAPIAKNMELVGWKAKRNLTESV